MFAIRHSPFAIRLKREVRSGKWEVRISRNALAFGFWGLFTRLLAHSLTGSLAKW